MTKKPGYLILGCLSSSVALIVMLYIFSGNINHRKNAFIRLFPSHFISHWKVLDIQYNSYYIAGLTDNHIYLGNQMQPMDILISNYDFSDSQFKHLNPFSTNRIAWRLLKVSIDSPTVYMMEGLTPTILKVNISTSFSENCPIDSTHFDISLPYSTSSFIVRSFNPKLNSNILGKVITQPFQVRFAPSVLENQQDGVFSTDGIINYDPTSRLVVYLYYYRNQFICMDSNLDVLYRGHTIDTVSHANIKIGLISSEHTMTLASPPLIVNRRSCASNGWLFVNSELIAKNEDRKDFNGNSVIDIYSLKDGRYKYSFYLPKYHGVKVISL